jgi:type I restriction enzyme R subunit
MPSFISNFEFLKHHDELLFRLAEKVKDAFHTIRKLGNIANHQYIPSYRRDALKCMQVGCALSGGEYQLWLINRQTLYGAENLKIAPDNEY